MGKKPLIGLACLCVVGAALVGCRQDGNCCGGGKTCPNPAGSGRQQSAWNTPPKATAGGTVALPGTGSMPTGASNMPAGTGADNAAMRSPSAPPLPTDLSSRSTSPLGRGLEDSASREGPPPPASPTVRQANHAEVPPVPALPENLPPAPLGVGSNRELPDMPEMTPPPPPAIPPRGMTPTDQSNLAPPPPLPTPAAPMALPASRGTTRETNYLSPPPPPPPSPVPTIPPGSGGEQ